jgi:hypothetical protein
LILRFNGFIAAFEPVATKLCNAHCSGNHHTTVIFYHERWDPRRSEEKAGETVSCFVFCLLFAGFDAMRQTVGNVSFFFEWIGGSPLSACDCMFVWFVWFVCDGCLDV